jgi:hypothetical protein
MPAPAYEHLINSSACQEDRHCLPPPQKKKIQYIYKRPKKKRKKVIDNYPNFFKDTMHIVRTTVSFKPIPSHL